MACAAVETMLSFDSAALFPFPVRQRGMSKLHIAVMSDMSKITISCRSGGGVSIA